MRPTVKLNLWVRLGRTMTLRDQDKNCRGSNSYNISRLFISTAQTGVTSLICVKGFKILKTPQLSIFLNPLSSAILQPPSLLLQ
jgi:hypothetical protein